MSEIVVDLPEDLKKVMSKHKSVDWSGIAEEAIRKAAAEIELLNAIASESKLTEEDALKLGRKVKKGMWDRVYKKLV
ncbi:MAG: hypothetical protein D6733_03660 [Methanobacteriota archaeon]|nr:MAG: hypothetical protein D6733_03660 [Euryarchaeota archaeon]